MGFKTGQFYFRNKGYVLLRRQEQSTDDTPQLELVSWSFYHFAVKKIRMPTPKCTTIATLDWIYLVF